MLPVHSLVVRLLLVGVRPRVAAAAAEVPPPAALAPLVAALAEEHQRLDALAVRRGNRYRSTFWSIYLLSALAVLFGALPPALGWDQRDHGLHVFARFWGVCELLTIVLVGVLYALGNRQRWQAQWLGARSDAELVSNLPLVAPLIDRAPPELRTADWYARAFGASSEQASEVVRALCRRWDDTAARVAGAWGDSAFTAGFAAWVCSRLDTQRHYHRRLGAVQHALLHRVHAITAGLYALTAAGAAAHLLWHSLWLSVLTLFCPALGAALHGALAQSEAYRLEQGAHQLVARLGQAIEEIDRALAAADAEALRRTVGDAVQVLLAEHQDWHGLVKPHDLPLG